MVVGSRIGKNGTIECAIRSEYRQGRLRSAFFVGPCFSRGVQGRVKRVAERGGNQANGVLSRPQPKLVWDGRIKEWELYDLKADRCETNDLAAQQPDRVKAMSSDWFTWAKKTGAPGAKSSR